jgi:hypothetical protein
MVSSDAREVTMSSLVSHVLSSLPTMNPISLNLQVVMDCWTGGTEIKGIRSSSVRQCGVVVKCQSHKRLATDNRPG